MKRWRGVKVEEREDGGEDGGKKGREEGEEGEGREEGGGEEGEGEEGEGDRVEKWRGGVEGWREEERKREGRRKE